MNTAVIRQLVLKDWYLYRVIIALILLGCLGTLVATGLTTGVTRQLAGIGFLVAFNVLMFLPMWTVVSDRRDQTLVFQRSLPVTGGDYTLSKVLSNLSIFLGIWLPLVLLTLLLNLALDAVPNGSIPYTLLLFVLVFALFCLNFAVALVSESEPVSIAAAVVSNLGFWVFWNLTIPVVQADFQGNALVWHPLIVWGLAAALLAIPLILGLVFLLQSRKTDFI